MKAAPRPEMPPVGPQIRAAREALGWTAYRLAKEAGMRQSHVIEIEEGRRRDPSWSSVCRLADALGVRVDKLRGPIK